MSERPPVVGLDYLPAVTHPPGVGRYVRELVRALVRLPDAPPLRLFELGVGARVMEGEPLGLTGARDVRRLRGPLPRRAVSWLGRAGLGADRLLGGVDLFHRVFPDWPPVSRARETLAIAELPAVGTPTDAALGAAARRAAAVLVFSGSYAERVAERYDVPPARVHALGVGCEHWARAQDRADPPARATPPRLLALGALRRARHPELLLRGFEHLRAGGLEAELALFGRPSDAADAFRAALERSPVRAHVRWEPDVPERDLPRRVAECTALVHLANEEGSPVTPLEACSLGLDVVAARLPAFEEVLGDEALYVDLARVADDPAILADALARALQRASDEDRRRARRQLASLHTWEANARRTLRIWQDVPRRSPESGLR